MESAFLRMWDPKIFCSSVVLWSSVVHAFWCYPGSVVHIFLTLSWLVPGPLDHYQNCCSFYPPHSFNFDFKVFVFWESFSYFHWSVLFSEMDVSMNTQLVSCLFLITMSGLWPLSQYLFVLAFATRLWCCLVTVSGSCSDHFSFMSIFISLQMFQWRYDHGSFVGVCMYSVLASSWSQCTLPQYGE